LGHNCQAAARSLPADTRSVYSLLLSGWLVQTATRSLPWRCPPGVAGAM